MMCLVRVCVNSICLCLLCGIHGNMFDELNGLIRTVYIIITNYDHVCAIRCVHGARTELLTFGNTTDEYLSNRHSEEIGRFAFCCCLPIAFLLLNFDAFVDLQCL